MNLLIVNNNKYNLNELEKALYLKGYVLFLEKEIHNALESCLLNCINTIIFEYDKDQYDIETVAKELKKISCCKIKVIIITEVNLSEYEENEFNDFIYMSLVKPFDFKTLLNNLHEISIEENIGAVEFYKRAAF